MLGLCCFVFVEYLSTHLELFASDRTASSLTYFCICICVCYCICTFCICTCQQTKDISLLVRPLLYCSRQDRVGSDPQPRRLAASLPPHTSISYVPPCNHTTDEKGLFIGYKNTMYQNTTIHIFNDTKTQT